MLAIVVVIAKANVDDIEQEEEPNLRNEYAFRVGDQQELSETYCRSWASAPGLPVHQERCNKQGPHNL